MLKKNLLILLLAAAIATGSLAVQAAADKHGFGEKMQATANQLEGKIYCLIENTESLPNFASMTPLAGSIYTTALDIEQRNFEEGFPGITDRIEWFALAYTGKFGIHQAGQYTFALNSDDGSRLYIDGNLVVNNDGIHPPSMEEASVFMPTGNHTIRVEYFQGPRYDIALQLFITPPGGEQTIFSLADYPTIK
jgi:hypothetical protein